MKSLAVIAAFVISAYAASTLPVNCFVTESWEDGSAIAHCLDGRSFSYDPDGQPYANTAGNPIRSPGWYEITHEANDDPSKG